MKLTKQKLKQIIMEELEPLLPTLDKQIFGDLPADAPAKLTTAQMSPAQFLQMIDTWGAKGSGSRVSAEKIYSDLGGGNIEEGRKQLGLNYAGLKKRMESEGKGKLPRKYMPVVKKAFVEDLFNRLKKGKLDHKDPFAATSGKYKGKHVAGKGGRIKDKDVRRQAKQSIKEASKEDYTQYKARRRSGFSPIEQSKYAEYLPDKNFPSLQDFEAMPDPEKAKSYWLNKGKLDGDKTDDVIEPSFTTMPVSELHPSQDRVYADKIGWKLLELGAGQLAPLKDPDLVDPATGASTSAPDWRYRSIVIEGGLLLDGHHKWALASLSGNNAPVPVLYLPQLDLATTINLLRSYGASQGFAGQA